MITINSPLYQEKHLRSVLRLQSVALHAVHQFFREEGFYQLMPVMLSPVTDPLGADGKSGLVKTGELEYLGQRFQLTQSMILQKQVAIGHGIDRLYIMSPNIRLETPEKSETGRHAFEFTQIDYEIAYAKKEDIFRLTEGLLHFVRSQVEDYASEELEFLGKELHDWSFEFPKYTSHELLDLYGEDWEVLASKDAKQPFWVMCHDREFYDKEDRTRQPGHFLNYDLYYPEGYGEALSGAEREFEYEYLLKRLREDNLSEGSYQNFLDMAKTGRLSPSAGAGLGVERLIRFLSGTTHIGDIQLFRRIPGEEVRI